MPLGWAGSPSVSGCPRGPSPSAVGALAMLGSKQWRSYARLRPSGLHPWLALELRFPNGPDSAVIWQKSPQQQGAQLPPSGHLGGRGW